MPMHAFAKIQWYIFKYTIGLSTFIPIWMLEIGSYHTGNPGEHGACIGENVREKGLCVGEKSGKCPGKRSWNFVRHPVA